VVICVGQGSQGADLHMAQLMPLPLTVSCSSKSRMVSGFTVLVPAHLGSRGQNLESRKMVVVVVLRKQIALSWSTILIQ